MSLSVAPVDWLAYVATNTSINRQSDAKPAQLRPELLNPQTVEPINAEEFRRLLAHHRGEVLAVNLWATWCVPCLKELPDLRKLQEQYRGRGLRVIAVSVDDPQELEAKVKPFFRARAPGLVSYLQTEPDQDKFVSVVDPAWGGIVPTTFVIDRAGGLKASLVGRKTYEEFEAAIKPLLDEASGGLRKASDD
jgi:thiol-disulfide isomerase/thioredoxin